MNAPCYIRVAGKKNSGKTTLIVALVGDLAARGYRVATLKHTSHNHEFDRPGSDSQRHTAAGSLATVIVSPERLVCHARRPRATSLADYLRRTYDGCDIVLCEGHAELAPSATPTPLVECVPPGGTQLFAGDPELVAVVTDTPITSSVATFSRSDAPALATWLIKTCDLRPGSGPQPCD
jgi:molybdopterin-guanine dinucleotide biosynthesis protein B